ncbi:MAG: OmpH family outer membrane protein [Bacteroidia bacterium]|nr:OmpH family outer membrane protein [Bacteroidia bacterium]
MKKILLVLLFSSAFAGFAQKYAFVDTQYILSNIPSFKAAQDQLDKFSVQYQKELETIHGELDKMYKDFQAEAVLLSDDMKRKREDIIITKEKEYKKLQRQYFGAEGELFQKRQTLIKPIQDDVFKVIQEISEQGGYAMVFDKSGSLSMVYSNAKYDLSDQILQKLGYKN